MTDRKNKRIISHDKSIIIAADVEFKNLPDLVKKTGKVKGIGGYKIGFELGLEVGLPRVVSTIRKYTKLPIIYDHQKAGNDVPAFGMNFARVCKKAGLDAVILFPFTGPSTEKEWILQCQKAGLKIIVGGIMTHEKFLQKEGGYIADSAPEKIYNLAMKLGVKDFVLPGTKIDQVKKFCKLFTRKLGKNKFIVYSPGFITQGGDISVYSKFAGNFWHAIVGRAVYNAKNINQAATNLGSKIK